MSRPTFVPQFEESEATIRARMIGRVSSEWRKEPGDFIYDAVAPSAEEVKGLEINLDYALKNGFGQYAEGVYMDELLAELGLERNPATSNKRALSIQAVAGVVIDKGHTLVTVVLDKDGNQIEFTVDGAHTYAVNGTATINITSKTKGAISNVPNGSEFTFTPTIPGIVSITDSGTTYPGVDAEGDESCWDRYQFKVNNIETGGNKNDYVRWAKEVVDEDGIAIVGKAKCIPRWDGPGSVKVLLVDGNNDPATQTVIDDVQEYLDPGKTGLGEGRAPCGAQVTVVAATALTINVTANNVVLVGGYSIAAVKAAFEEQLETYLKTTVFTYNPGTTTNVSIIYNRISALLFTTEGIINFNGLQVNGGTADIIPSAEQVAKLGTVTLNQ